MPKKPSTSKRSAPSSGSSVRNTAARSRIVDSSDDSSGEDYTQRLSQRPSTSTQNRATTQGSNTQRGLDDLKAITNMMVKYFLNFSAMKLPIKRSDITKNLNIGPKEFPDVFKDCRALLNEIYGLDVTEVGDKSNKAYLVYTACRMGVCLQQYSTQQRSEITLLFIMLSYIFMKGGNIQEAHLIGFLAQLNINTNDPDPVYGDVPKMIREKFARQLYLKRFKAEMEGSNEPVMHLSWGARADKEFDKMEILKAVGEIMNKSPVTFINQYHEATKGEEEQEENSMIID